MSDDLLDAMVVAHYGGAPEDALCDLGVDGMDYELKAMARVLAELRKRGALVPEGWQVVPDEANMTDEQAEAIAHVGRCCGGIAYDIYRAALAAAPAPTTGEG